MNLDPRYFYVDGEKFSRLWWYRVWRRLHNIRCAECRRAYR